MSDPKFRTNKQNVAALLHYLGLPMTVECNPKTTRCEFVFPMSMSQETCAGTVDLEVENILKRFYAGECEVSDAKALLNAMLGVVTQMNKAKNRVGS